MTGRTAYVLGAGLAGLAAASRLAEAGCSVKVFEAAPNAGGRCRSFHDSQIEAEIDNGNHLILSGNTDALVYLERIGAMDTVEFLPAVFPFLNLKTNERWTVSIGKGRIPWRILCSHHRVPGASLGDYWRSRKLMQAQTSQTIAQALSDTGALYEGFWKPFSIAVLNTEPEVASAWLLKPVIRETLGQGGVACRPLIAKQGLGNSFVAPALSYLETNKAKVLTGARCRGITVEDGAVTAILINDEEIRITADDLVIAALPPAIMADLLANGIWPDTYRSIVNAHYKLPQAVDKPTITGLIGGLAEWLFIRGDIASVTISAADPVVDLDAETLKRRIWDDIAPVLGLPVETIPPVRIIKEKRATIAQTPESLKKRPNTVTDVENLWVAGDWTNTGLPATIEGAIRSGHRAAVIALNL